MSIEINNNNKDVDEDIPTNVHKKEELALIPEKYLSDDPKRPLLLTTSSGEKFKYALNPLMFSVLAILVIEAIERWSFYSVNLSQTEFLVGHYSPDWNPDMTGAQATQFTNLAKSLTYAWPFIGGIIADGLTGDYWNIVIACTLFYIPGFLLVWLTTFPELFGPEFPTTLLRIGIVGLVPLGAGLVKPVVNIFGAKQYHPLLQAEQLEQYYVYFYAAIQFGAFFGPVLTPILAQYVGLEAAYGIPPFLFMLGLAVFLLFSKRYVRRPPEKKALFDTLGLFGKSIITCKSVDKSKTSNGGYLSDDFVDGCKRLLLVVPVSALSIPFNIAYDQMLSTFELQGNAMSSPVKWLDAAMMQNFDPVAVLIAAGLMNSVVYPALEKRKIRIPLATKFAIGTAFGALAMLSAALVDWGVHRAIENESEISILWQLFSFMFVGFGEVFAITTTYEAAFIIAPKEQKGLSSGIQLFVSMSVPGFIEMGITALTESWFPTGDTVEEYQQSKMGQYFWVLFGICALGVLINLLPPVKNWLERLREDAIAATALSETNAGDDNDVDYNTSADGGDNEADIVEMDQVVSERSIYGELVR